MDEWLHQLGRVLGGAIRWLVELLQGFFSTLFAAVDQFFQGLASALGIDVSIVSFLVLALGLWLLYGGARALLRRRWFGGLARCFLGVFLLSALID
ncbi:hypothetical protein [Algiphilus sp.]|uniref:hypothetical protein n=1 Tax=Algiphilus sp. TaxID=1872431 RepID=UPI001CA728F7|nr:hypothetical protein [Algiphilus sp.]MBY8964218.1 hypothetical protein [Algiphilus acroporae]MCI5061532.1 hypothetical protein [Algiphilus sp.]MCI5102612.1 hypothetical protein [Algiphilus sp.]MCR9091511.1 hypothetical protein [Pseudomonadota bacterium]